MWRYLLWSLVVARLCAPVPGQAAGDLQRYMRWYTALVPWPTFPVPSTGHALTSSEHGTADGTGSPDSGATDPGDGAEVGSAGPEDPGSGGEF